MDKYDELEDSDFDDFSDSSDIYSEKGRNHQLDNDEIDGFEAGFTQGWDDAL